MLGGTGKAVAVLCVVCALIAPAAVANTHRKQTSLVAGVLADVNAVRRSHGLGALRLSPSLTTAAAQHSREMARLGYFAHESADGSSFDKRVARYYGIGANRYWSIGENLVWASPVLSAAEALKLWMNSPPHRHNLLTVRWREIGISAVHVASASGVYGDGPATIITADFGVRR